MDRLMFRLCTGKKFLGKSLKTYKYYGGGADLKQASGGLGLVLGLKSTNLGFRGL